MKILCNIGHGANGFMKRAWEQVFKFCGHEFVYWNPDKDDVEKAFSIEPDLFIGTTYDFYRAQLNQIRKRPNMKVALIGADWGPMTERMDLSKNQIVYASTKEIKLIEELKPDLIFIHYTEEAIDETHGYWRDKLGIKIAAITQCADLFDYYKGNPNSQFKADISFVGGYWPYKAQNLDKYLLPLCKRFGRYDIKIYGNQGWPVPHYKGLIPTEHVKDVFASSLICPNISEPHADLGVELMERPFKVISSGGFCVSQSNLAMKQVFGNTVPYFSNPFEFFDMVNFYKKNPDKRPMKEAYDLVMSKHTGFHRVAKMLRALGLENEAQHVDNRANDFGEML